MVSPPGRCPLCPRWNVVVFCYADNATIDTRGKIRRAITFAPYSACCTEVPKRRHSQHLVVQVRPVSGRVNYNSNVVMATLTAAGVRVKIRRSSHAGNRGAPFVSLLHVLCRRLPHQPSHAHIQHQRRAAVSCDIDDAPHGACKKAAGNDMTASRQEQGHHVTSTSPLSRTRSRTTPLLTKATSSTRRSPPHSHHECCLARTLHATRRQWRMTRPMTPADAPTRPTRVIIHAQVTTIPKARDATVHNTRAPHTPHAEGCCTTTSRCTARQNGHSMGHSGQTTGKKLT